MANLDRAAAKDAAQHLGERRRSRPRSAYARSSGIGKEADATHVEQMWTSGEELAQMDSFAAQEACIGDTTQREVQARLRARGQQRARAEAEQSRRQEALLYGAPRRTASAGPVMGGADLTASTLSTEFSNSLLSLGGLRGKHSLSEASFMDADAEDVEALAVRAARQSFQRRYPPPVPLTVRISDAM